MAGEASLPQHGEEDLRALIYTYNNYKAMTEYKKGHVVCLWLDSKSVLTSTMRALQTLVDQNPKINYKYNRKTLLGYVTRVIHRVKQCVPGQVWSNMPGKQCVPEQEWTNILHFLEEPFRIPFSWGNFKSNLALQNVPVSKYQLAHVSKVFKAVHANKGKELMDDISMDEGRKCIATPDNDTPHCVDTNEDRKFEITCNKSVAVNFDRKVNTRSKRKNKKVKITPRNEGANPVVETSNDKLSEINKQLRAKIAKYQHALNDPKIKKFKYLDKKIERLLGRRVRRQNLIKNLKHEVSILRSKYQKNSSAQVAYEKHLKTQRQKIDELKIDCEKKSLELDMLQKTFKEQFHSINRLKRELADVRKMSDNAMCELDEAREELIREELAEEGAY